jgi:uncharacterized protein (DUF1501 family)
MELGALQASNERHLAGRGVDPLLAARIKSFETAFGMQSEMPEAFDLAQESTETHALYGLEPGSTQGFAWQCLVARRLAERGVRFIELIDVGSSANWDAHGDMLTHLPLAKNVDQPIAGLLQDLKRRGMLDDTLVVWGGEFGRTVYGQGGLQDDYGRDHHGRCYSVWMAGGGIRPGVVHGETDDYGYNIVRDPVHVHDLNATLLQCLGYDHKRLTYRFQGRDYRLTDVEGNVVKEILA